MYEPVHEITEYYDGPRSGLANFGHEKCCFVSYWLDVYRDEEDIFEITVLSGVNAGMIIYAHATFRKLSTEPTLEGEWPKLEVLWQPLAQAPK